jgi:YVTN family beta-propeller protein
VTNFLSSDVSVIATASNTVVATIPVEGNPAGVAVTPDGAFAYATSLTTNVAPGFVSVIETASNSVIASIPVGVTPFAVAITPDGSFAYVTNRNSNTVSVIATASNTVVATVPVGGLPLGIAITPDGAFAYVANQAVHGPGANTVSVIETATNTVVTTIPFDGSPRALAITPDAVFAYVVTLSAGTWVIATATNTVVTTIPLGSGGPFGGDIAITPDGAFVYVRSGVIETATNTVVAGVSRVVGEGVAFTPDGAFAYVTNGTTPGVVIVLETASNSVIASIPVGDRPAGVALARDSHIQIEIDIKPGSDPNPLNLKSKGVIPVAILGTADFDVTDVDCATLAFGPGGAMPVHKALGHIDDVNGDGYDDLVSHYRTQEAGVSPDDTEACVTGATTDGTSIEGCDVVRIKG